jgi:hypothetical protein
MTLFKAQVIIQNMRYKLSITNAGLDMLNEKQALDMANTILEKEIAKERGCLFCNEKMSSISINYASGNCDCNVNSPTYCFNCGRKL